MASTNLAKLVADKEAEITFLREQISEERIRDEKDMASAQDEIVDLRTKLTKEAASSGAEDELREQLQSAQASADALSKELAEQRVEFAELEEALAASQLNLAAREEEAARLREELAALNEENAKGGRGERERELAPQAMTRLSAPPLSEQSSPRSEEIPPSEESLSSEEPPEEARAAAAPFNLFDDEPGAAPNAQSSEEQAAVKEEAEREIGGGAKQVEELPRVLVLDDLLAENSSEVLHVPPYPPTRCPVQSSVWRYHTLPSTAEYMALLQPSYASITISCAVLNSTPTAPICCPGEFYVVVSAVEPQAPSALLQPLRAPRPR